MPAFRSLVGSKRPAADNGPESRKRQSLGSAIGDTASDLANDPMKVGEQYWMVQWRAPQTRKHKTWDGDGVLVLSGGNGVLHDMDGRILASGKPSPDGACIGVQIFLGGKEMEVDSAVSRNDFMSGKIFGRGGIGVDTTEVESKPRFASASSLKKKFVPLRPVSLNASAPVKSTSDDTSYVKRGIVSLRPVDLVQNTENEGHPQDTVVTAYWFANWRKPQTKKHKTWDGDAYIIHSGKKLTVITDEGKLMGSATWDGVPLYPGSQVKFSGKVAEIQNQVPGSVVPRIVGVLPSDAPSNEEVDDLEAIMVNEEFSGTGVIPQLSISIARKDVDGDISVGLHSETHAVSKRFVGPTSFYGNPVAPSRKEVKPAHDPDEEDSVVMKAPSKEHQKKFNIKHVMFYYSKHATANNRDRPIVAVVIDPLLRRRLRPHQVEGVKFLYECVMGLRKHEGQGCILADEMGMGKTLQTITLVWTLLKQNPYAGGGPAVGKVLIVCPVSLITNWKKEFHKWLGKDRVGVFTGDKDKTSVKQFINSYEAISRKIHQVLVIGYEKLRTVISELAYCMPPIGLIICDEGHRLKSANNKTSTMFDALRTPRRIILSGTPIQNDLSEFHAMADFCNPGLLDDYSTFKKVFENPILKSRAPGCSEKERELGEARQAQLQAVARSFVLRRDATILNNYLPPKHEYVVFVTPSNIQKAMITKILQPDTLSSLLSGSMARSLAMIQLLTKLSTSPMLLKAALEKQASRPSADGDDVSSTRTSVTDALKLLPSTAVVEDVSLSGKLLALSKLLRYIRKETEEKCILVSHYTSTLNVIEAFCKKNKYNFLRLDGQTPVAKRQEYVDTFNRARQSSVFLFLLSAKAGGVGLNLIGASRLCLIDSDWNPSHDLQSMARIHRDGQKNPVFIYRLLTAGTIDEKIFQRQVTKLGLSDSLMGKGTSEGDGKSKSDSFTAKDLRDLFTFHSYTACHTHELLGCSCTMIQSSGGPTGLLVGEDEDKFDEEETQISEKKEMGFISASQCKPEALTKMDKAYAKKKKAELASLGEWTHINCCKASAGVGVIDNALQTIIAETSASSPSFEENNDEHQDDQEVLPSNIPGGAISFLFEKVSKSPI